MNSVAIPVLDATQVTEWDALSIARGIPSRVLMESAGRAAASIIAQEFSGNLSDGIVVAAGHGNNGGDGWVVARALSALGVPVWAVETHGQRSDDCEANRALALEGAATLLSREAKWPNSALVVDALLGTGANGEPRGEIGEIATRVVNHCVPIVAIDGPTGLDLSTGEAHGPVRADLTVTFGGLRRGHLLAREWCGRIVVAEMGFGAAPDPNCSEPGWPYFVDDRWVADRLPQLRPAMHKGDRGRILIVGGRNGMAGAARHAARAALAGGAGLVKIAAQQETVAALQEGLPDAMSVTTALNSEIEQELLDALEWADAVVLGPGMGREPERTEFVRHVLEAASGGTREATAAPSFVIDADALHVGRDAWGAGRVPRVLTPHLGEFKAAFPEYGELVAGDRFGAATAAAREAGGWPEKDAVPFTVLLKGVPTVIASGNGQVSVTASGNPALATGGSGDLLAGFVATFMAQELEPHAAAAVGAHVLGRAAEIASAETSVRSTRPDDVLSALPDLWHELAAPQLVEPPVLLCLDAPLVV